MPHHRSAALALHGAKFLFIFAGLSCLISNAEARHRKHAKTLEAALPAGDLSAAESPVQIDRVDGSTLYFKTTDGSKIPSPLNLEPLVDIQPIGVLKSPGSTPPYFLVHAKPCKECRQEPAVYAVQAENHQQTRFSDPGKILDNRSRAVVMEARGFFGRCLPGRAANVLVIFQKERVDRKRGPQSSVLIAEPVSETIDGQTTRSHLHEELVERRLPRINSTLSLVKRKACREIEGRNRVMANHPPDVSLKRQKPVEEDDDEEDDKRDNESDRDFNGAATPAAD